LKGPLSALAAKARPDERTILKRLPAKLGMSETPTVEEIRRQLNKNESEAKDSEAELSAADTAYTELVERVQEEVREIWPELNATYAPLAMELTSDRTDEFVKRVGDLSSYQALQSATKRQAELSQKQLKLARTEARLQRLLQTCEDVALRANLPKVAPAEIVTRYEKLLAIEESTLVP
jgi:vacuolar-type H+-ATPase subunit D/Vma8